ncbi:MAG TPA: glycosyltransferase family 2 protein [Terriglobia bacterium]|nr:glycosyltransferase family 2 protein [Terriglobia bacterium]
MDLSIISVNWNSVRYLRDCLRSIYRFTTGVSFEVIIVDNASSERDVDSLYALFPDIRIIQSIRNLGFAAANNVAFTHSSGDYIVFINPDTTLVGPAITTLYNAIRSLPDAGMVGGTLLNPDLSVQSESIQTFPTILNQVLDSQHLRKVWPGCPLWDGRPSAAAPGVPARVDMIPGPCMVVKRTAFEAVGGFTEDYFMYAEDIDLNYKMAQLGLHRYYIESAQIIHHGGTSSKKQSMSQWPTMMKFRAMLLYYGRTRGELYALMYRLAMGGNAVIRLVLLGLAFPFAMVSRGAERVAWAAAKWRAVLRCAVGLHNLPSPQH